MAVDYGTKRTGLAVTDNAQIIATGLETVPTHQIFDFLKKYFVTEKVATIVVGKPTKMNNEDSESAKYVNIFCEKFKKTYPDIQIIRYDERFTSKIASQTLVSAGLKKHDRQKKELLDVVSATILLQDYMEYNKNEKNR